MMAAIVDTAYSRVTIVNDYGFKEGSVPAPNPYAFNIKNQGFAEEDYMLSRNHVDRP
jgi:hypothetical protein